LKLGFFLIVLILNVPDQLFQQVFHRHQTCCAAVFVLNHGNLNAGTAKLVQQFVNSAVFRNDERQAHH